MPLPFARKIDVYSDALKIALAQIPADQRRARPEIPLRVDASIRRQLEAGAADAHTIAFTALKDILVPDAP